MFKSERNLRDHLNEVHKQQVYKCTHRNCQRSYTRARTLQKHMECHEDSRHHLCDYCGAEYNLKTSLIKHIKARHNSTWSAIAENKVLPQHLGGSQQMTSAEPMVEGGNSQLDTASLYAASAVNFTPDDIQHSTMSQNHNAQQSSFVSNIPILFWELSSLCT